MNLVYDCNISKKDCLIGKGAEGKVYRVRDPQTNLLYALKIMKFTNDDELNNIINQLKILRTVKHKNIVKLIKEAHDDKKVYLLFPFYEHGNLS